MKIVVPMAGTGARFVQAGYSEPKPLIRLRDGRRIIEHVLDMFRDPVDKFVFVCNEDHLDQTDMTSILWRLRPGSRVVPIAPHKKGPVWSCVPAFPYIEDDEEVIVSYCDGTLPLNRQALSNHAHEHELDGCLLTHSGFHPHALSLTTKMAYLRLLENAPELVAEVREKASFTDSPAAEHASSGVYYFHRGAFVKRYFEEYLRSALDTYNGEHYVTLAYNLMIRDGLRVGYLDTPHVAILGTPAEVRNFEAWGEILEGSQVRNEEDLLRCYRYWQGYHGK